MLLYLNVVLIILFYKFLSRCMKRRSSVCNNHSFFMKIYLGHYLVILSLFFPSFISSSTIILIYHTK